MANYRQTGSISGLETLTMNVDVAGQYTLKGKFAAPSARDTGVASQVIATIKHNGTTIFTSTAGQTGFSTPVNCAASDTLSIALSSSAAEDAVLNAVNAVISLG